MMREDILEYIDNGRPNPVICSSRDFTNHIANSKPKTCIKQTLILTLNRL